MTIIKIALGILCLVLANSAYNTYSDNYKIHLADLKSKDKIYDILNCGTLRAKYYRSTMAWNEAVIRGKNWPVELQQQVMSSAYIEMKQLYEIVPGYKDVTKYYTVMENARQYVQ